MKLDLACGARCAEGYEGVDLHPLAGVSWLCDLTATPWRVRRAEHPDRCIDVEVSAEDVTGLRCAHFVEHVPDLVGFMNEAHRVLRPGGEFVVICPYQFSVAAWQDPTHVRAINEVTFSYFDARWRAENEVDHYLGITADFEVRAVAPSRVGPAYKGLSLPELQEAASTYVNVIQEITAVLVKR